MTSDFECRRICRFALPAAVAALVAVGMVQSQSYALDAHQLDGTAVDAQVQAANIPGTTHRGRTPNRLMDIARLGKVKSLYALVTPQDPVLSLCEADITEGGWGLTLTGAQATFGGNATGDRRGFADGQQQYVDHNDVEPFTFHSVVVISVFCENVLDDALGEGKRAIIEGQGDVRSQSPFAMQVAFEIELHDFGEPGRGRDIYQIRLAGGFVYDSGPMTLEGGNIQIRY